MVWQDNFPGNLEIYYGKSADGGANWTTGQRLTWTAEHSSGPAIGVDSNHTVHIVWDDTPPGIMKSII